MLNTTTPADVPGDTADQHFRDLVLLRRMLLYTKKDDEYLQLAAPVINASSAQIMHAWYDYISADPYLSNYFKPGTAEEFAHSRFSDWLQQLCSRGGLRQWEALEKQVPENAGPLKPLQPELLRYLTAFAFPVIQAGNEALHAAGMDAPTLANVKQAWFKAVTLSIALWAYPNKN